MNKEKNQLMFGVEDIKNWTNEVRQQGPALWMACSMLSDVQEMVERDMKEEARLQINRVKYLLKEAEEGKL